MSEDRLLFFIDLTDPTAPTLLRGHIEAIGDTNTYDHDNSVSLYRYKNILAYNRKTSTKYEYAFYYFDNCSYGFKDSSSS